MLNVGMTNTIHIYTVHFNELEIKKMKNMKDDNQIKTNEAYFCSCSSLCASVQVQFMTRKENVFVCFGRRPISLFLPLNHAGEHAQIKQQCASIKYPAL